MRRRSLLLLLLPPLVACTPRRSEGPEAEPRPEVVLTGVRVRVFRGNALAAVGRAAQVSYRRESGEVSATEATVRLPPRQGAGRAAAPGARGGTEVRAREVVGQVGARQAEARGDVVVRSGVGLVGRTERAHYDGVGRQVTGEVPVEVVNQGVRTRADGFAFDLGAEVYSFRGNVVTRLEGQDGKALKGSGAGGRR